MTSDIESGKVSSENKIIKGNYTSLDPPFYTDYSRRNFIKKVFSCVLIQLFANFTFTIIAYTTPEVSDFIKSETGISLLYVFCALLLCLSCVPFCSESVLRKHPTNLYYYGVYTVCTSYLVTCVCVVTDPQIVLLALIGTMVIVLSLTLFTMQTKIDFTPCSGILFIFLIILVFGSLITSFLPQIKLVKLGLCLFGLFLFSMYLIIDIQMIVGGDHIKFQFEESDFILAALCLYLDILNIFLRMIELMQYGRE